MKHQVLVAALLGSCVASAAPAGLLPVIHPTWTGPQPDPSLPDAGIPKLPGLQYTKVYQGSAEYGLYAHAAMIGFYDGLMVATWKIGAVHEDKPGQHVGMATSRDGVHWDADLTGAPRIAFPNISMHEDHGPHLFAEPPIVINGHLYLAASPEQFCLYPDQYKEVLLMRRLYTNTTSGTLGPLFWAWKDVPFGFGAISNKLAIKPVSKMDEVTQADIATLTAKSTHPPCAADLAVDHTTKCEACVGGCQSWLDAELMMNERTHYVIPGTDGTANMTSVLLYRTEDGHMDVATRVGLDSDWSIQLKTGIPDEGANFNAGVLPDGRIYLLNNANPKARNPIALTTSKDGVAFNDPRAVASCSDLPPPGQMNGTMPANCTEAVAYPQGIVISGAPGFDDKFHAIFSYGGSIRDIYVVSVDLAAL